MKLPEKLEAEVKELYFDYFESLFSADVEKYESFFVDDFKQIGTTREEVWFSKSESGKYLATHVEPVSGKIEFRNRDIRMAAVDKLIFIIEQADCFVNIDGEWRYYDRARVSSVMQDSSTGWKFVQQHISFPDSRTEEGQTVGLQKIKAENIQLREAVKRRTAELENINRELENTIVKLKSTQAQLIQSEKMASLGELTAGIAHEIKNPLNFVNNFSEVSHELIFEMQEARNKNQNKIDVELENEILGDIKQNLEKISHHGKRADAIVKSMLERSKRSSGQKEITDINKLVEDFLSLSYQSYLAKDKEFSVELQLNLDPNLPKVSVIPQDIGKVLINLYGNALYACSDQRISTSSGKRKELSSSNSYQDEDLTGIKSKVTVSTINLDDKIQISIKDNGPGIPDSIKDKIFQPFFTTKPTGIGTGLGLSLSYDIVKAHGGDLQVKSNEGEGAEMIIFLPLEN